MRKLFNFMPEILLSIGMVFFYQSCSDDNFVTNQDLKTEARNDGRSGGSGDGSTVILDWEVRFKLNNPYRNQLAEVISIACCRKPILKTAIKSSIIDFRTNFILGEDEMFFNIQKDKPISMLSGKSISQELIASVPEKPVVEILDFLCKNDPGLAILLEGNLNSTSISDDVYIDENFDDSSLDNAIFAYECGTRKQKTIRDGENNPSMIFILRESEAYDPITSVGNDFIETKSLGVICNNEVVIIGSSINDPDTPPNGGGDPNVGGTVETRNNPCPIEWRTVQNGKENLYRYKTSKDYDPMRGNGEFLEYALFGKDLKYKINETSGKMEITGAVVDHVAKRQESVKNNFQWKVVNADLFRWYPENSGYTYKIVWLEDDGGNSKPLISKVTLTARIKLPDGTNLEGSLQFDFNRAPRWLTVEDDFIGENVIDYCDSENFDYTPNSIDVTVFNVNER